MREGAVDDFHKDQQIIKGAMCVVPAASLLAALVCVLQMKCQYGNMKKASTVCKKKGGKAEQEPLLEDLQENGDAGYS
jgi:hypothetical protein